MIIENPFLSNVFISVWCEHFNEGKSGQSFEFVSPLRFAKLGFLPVLYNLGGTLTKGIDYSLALYTKGDLAKKVLLIYDVPTYFTPKDHTIKVDLGFYSTKQYSGYLIDLEAFPDFSQYMLSTFSKSSRYKLNKYKRRLEECFDIEYRMWFGAISREEYDELFEHFRKLLEKRFEDKKVFNNNLDPKEWNFYYEVAYPMILQKKASLFVIYDSGIPISITLNYFSDTIIFDAITVFDIDYGKFHLGSVTIMKLIEWGIENQFKILDFSKGYFEYKTRWASKTYDFEYHIYFDPGSLRAKLIADGLKKFFDLKQYLRSKNLHEKLHKFTYRLKNGFTSKPLKPQYHFVELTDKFDANELDALDIKVPQNGFLRAVVFEFLYLNNECMKNLKVFKVNNGQIDYLFAGNVKNIGVAISKP